MASVLAEWARERDFMTTSAKYKPQVDAIASRWTTTKTYYSGLATSRDLDTALAIFKPDQTPRAADVSVLQMRDANGAMVHLVAVVLELQ